jgi:hypothetical protein
MKYNIWNAVAYEITTILVDLDYRWINNRWVSLIRKYCFLDWTEWKTQQTMKKVDKQIEEIQKAMKAEDDLKYVTPVITEHAPDGSTAQELLGGTLQITAPWYKPSTTNEQPNESKQS